MTGQRSRLGNGAHIAAALLLALSTAIQSTARAAQDGFHAQPGLGFTKGDHQVLVPIEFRYRWENWQAFAPESSDFHGIRTRVALDYRFKDKLRLFAQAQQSAVVGLSATASGVGGLYRSNNGNQDNPSSVRPSQIFAQFDAAQGSWIRAGRSYINMGTEVGYKEANWQYLKSKRQAQRLVGSVGWSNGARSNDGLASRVAIGRQVLHVFLAQPTTGVVVVDNEAYKSNDGILFGGLDWTAPRGVLLDNTELGAFFIGYSDTRDPAEVAGLFGDIEVYTLGGSMLGVYPVGKGRVDTLLWGAFQFGEYADQGPTTGVQNRDQLAGALVAEIGYQRTDLWAKPWLRLGVNWASGDGNLDDEDRNTFFNALPTNHLYYGYADQLAFQNLTDLLLQLKLTPMDKLGVEITYHRFWLDDSADFRWAGTGAFSRTNLGFARGASNGSTDVGQELDILVTYPVNQWLSVLGGYSKLWGGDVFATTPNSDVDFAYLQLQIKY
ncbi:MAG: alginate export family protein [Gammaproteobacteria bacterium]|nr:alginate export family protein [Gammaproteobacteria bacterium]